MPAPPGNFRDFGISPENLPPPPETVRSYLSTGNVIGQYIGTILVFAFGVGVALLMVFLVPPPLKWLSTGAAIVAFGAVLYGATRRDYRWVELTGDTIRARHLYTGWTLQRSIEEIESLSTMVINAASHEGAAIQLLLGRVKGIEIHFKNESTLLRVLRSDPAMTNAQELIQAILYRMQQKGQLDAETVQFEGQPLVRSVVWKGERPFIDTGPKTAKVIAIIFMFGALMAAAITSLLWMQESDTYQIASVPPQEIKLADLIKQGPGKNRHVTITDFEAGGYALEMTKEGQWKQVWVAVFPVGELPQEIQAVVSTKSISGEAQLRHVFGEQRFTGKCSAELDTSWGGTVGTNLVESNQGLPLKAAWRIDELGPVPTKETLQMLYYGAIGSCIATMLLAAIVVWKA